MSGLGGSRGTTLIPSHCGRKAAGALVRSNHVYRATGRKDIHSASIKNGKSRTVPDHASALLPPPAYSELFPYSPDERRDVRVTKLQAQQSLAQSLSCTSVAGTLIPRDMLPSFSNYSLRQGPRSGLVHHCPAPHISHNVREIRVFYPEGQHPLSPVPSSCALLNGVVEFVDDWEPRSRTLSFNESSTCRPRADRPRRNGNGSPPVVTRLESFKLRSKGRKTSIRRYDSSFKSLSSNSRAIPSPSAVKRHGRRYASSASAGRTPPSSIESSPLPLILPLRLRKKTSSGDSSESDPVAKTASRPLPPIPTKAEIDQPSPPPSPFNSSLRVTSAEQADLEALVVLMQNFVYL